MKTAIIALSLLLTFPLMVSAGKCKIPKKHTVCQRHCCYNYWGPGVHCTERCETKPVPLPSRAC
jgi:hypothetical protein